MTTGPPNRAPGLVLLQFSLRCLAVDRRQIAIVEPGVRVERVVLVIHVAAAGVVVRARAGDELDLHRALAGGVGTLCRGRDRHRLDRVEPWAETREKAVIGLQVVVLDAHTVEGDVDRPLGQAIDRRIAITGRGIEPGKKHNRVERVSAQQRQLADLVRVQGLRNRRGCGLHQLGAAGDGDHLFEAADFEHGADRGADAGGKLHFLDAVGLEPLESHRHGVEAGVQSRNRERSLCRRHCGRDGTRRLVLCFNGRARNQRARSVDDDTRESRRGAPLGEGRSADNGEHAHRCQSCTQQAVPHLSPRKMLLTNSTKIRKSIRTVDPRLLRLAHVGGFWVAQTICRGPTVGQGV